MWAKAPNDAGSLNAGITNPTAKRSDVNYKVVFTIPHHGNYVRWGAGKGVGGSKGR